MKNIRFLIACSTLIAFTFLLTGCGHNKKLQASKVRVEQLKKDSVETHGKLQEKNKPDKKKKVANVKVPAVPNASPTTPSPVASPAAMPSTVVPSAAVNNTETSTRPLPAEVEKVFKSNYPLVTQVTWTKEIPLLKVDKDTRDYKASFVVNEKKNSVVYAENGELIETRVQILPEQLPQNIYDAIKKRYQTVSILSATTIKNSRINGSYTAIIRTQTPHEEKEIMMMENGTFVE